SYKRCGRVAAGALGHRLRAAVHESVLAYGGPTELSQRALRNRGVSLRAGKPLVRDGMWAMREMRVGKRQLSTHNGLLIHYPGADGMKTGFICDSGFNIVASATRAGHKLIAVVFGEATVQERGLRAANLLEHGFRTYAWKALFGSQTLETKRIDEGAKR